MANQTPKFKVRLGLFVIVGIGLFILAIFIIGKQKNLFDPVFTLSTRFNNVSGLQVGNSVRFSGITVGTVDRITIINDTTVQVKMLIKEDVRKFIKVDSEAGIGSEGIIGDKIITISNGEANSKSIADNQLIDSNEPVEMDEIMHGLEITAGNAAIASEEITQILYKINKGEGTLGRLINDEDIANNLDKTIGNLKKGTKGLSENMEAAKDNFLLRGFFKKKEKAEKKRLKAIEKEKEKAREAKEKAQEEKEKAAKK